MEARKRRGGDYGGKLKRMEGCWRDGEKVGSKLERIEGSKEDGIIVITDVS